MTLKIFEYKAAKAAAYSLAFNVALTPAATAGCLADFKMVVDEIYVEGVVAPSSEATNMLRRMKQTSAWTDENGVPVLDEIHVLTMIAEARPIEVSEVKDGSLTPREIARSLHRLEECGLPPVAATAFLSKQGI